MRLPSRGLLLGKGLRETLRLKVGDSVTITVAGDGRRLTEPVAGFVDEPMTAVAYVALPHLDQVLGTPSASGALLKLRPGADRELAGHRLAALPGVAAYLDTNTLADAMRSAFTLYDTLVALMLVFAAVMAAALLFNAMSANVAERAVELGTLRAAGLSSGLLTRLVVAENLLLVLAGIPLGLVTGTLLARWFMATYERSLGPGHADRHAGRRRARRVRRGTRRETPVLRTMRRIDVARIVRERSL